MREKYGPLRELLAEAASRGDGTIELSFADIDEFAGGLPRSARTSRSWWANSSHTQALAWRAADWHVDMVSLDRERVRFTRGQVGGSFADRGRKAAGPVSPNRAQPIADAEAVVREMNDAEFAERGSHLTLECVSPGWTLAPCRSTGTASHCFRRCRRFRAYTGSR